MTYKRKKKLTIYTSLELVKLEDEDTKRSAKQHAGNEQGTSDKHTKGMEAAGKKLDEETTRGMGSFRQPFLNCGNLGQ